MCTRSMVINENGGLPVLPSGYWGNEFDRCSPRHYLSRLPQKDWIAGLLGTEIKARGGLFDGLYFLKRGLR